MPEWNLGSGTRANKLRGHALNELIRYRAMQAFCLQRAKMEHEDEMFWEAEAEVWARRAAHFDIKISDDASARQLRHVGLQSFDGSQR